MTEVHQSQQRSFTYLLKIQYQKQSVREQTNDNVNNFCLFWHQKTLTWFIDEYGNYKHDAFRCCLVRWLTRVRKWCLWSSSVHDTRECLVWPSGCCVSRSITTRGLKLTNDKLQVKHIEINKQTREVRKRQSCKASEYDGNSSFLWSVWIYTMVIIVPSERFVMDWHRTARSSMSMKLWSPLTHDKNI